MDTDKIINNLFEDKDKTDWMELLFKPAVTDDNAVDIEDLKEEDIVDPPSHYIDHDYDDEDDYSDYDQWIDDTYSADDLTGQISDMEDMLDEVRSVFNDTDCRYYPEEYSNLETALEQAMEAVRELKNRAEDYSTY